MTACAPAWRVIRRALIRRELLGKVRRGFFVQGLSGEQYAMPEAVDALRDAKLRRMGEGGGEEPMLLVTWADPANPFGAHFPVVNEAGEEITKRPGNMVVRGGQPVVLGGARLMVDMSRQEAERAVRAMTGRGEVRIANWNGHPIDVSPARHLLVKLGFAQDKKGYFFDGTHSPDAAALQVAGAEMPELFEREGKEEAPVHYDAEWIISRSHPKAQGLARKLIEFLGRALPDEYEFAYGPRRFMVLYRGVGIITPRIGQKQLWLHMFRRGWSPGMPIDAKTDFDSDEFLAEVMARLAKARALIDAELDR